ncbi:MAG TPA: GNAT family N-acetyltransferase [Parvularculaceae bacterium]|nr:GNAT family N-acetyltransferase [Parvularculaceae bacterium]
MADGSDTVLARTVSSIRDIGRSAWDACANADRTTYHPFASYDFLCALEESGSVDPSTGWGVFHLVLKEGGRISGVAPLYLKSHSQGEYVFDHHWADAYMRAGGRYYPKLLSATPFTPVPGPRLLAAGAAQKRALGAAFIEAAKKTAASSIHVNFLPEDEDRILQDLGFLPRRGVQYHWFNRGYESFDDFLAALASRKRKAIRRERKTIAESGLVIRHITGADISEAHWDAFWTFYQDTGSRKWGRPYLTRRFFSLVGERMADKILLIIAERAGKPIAGALNFIGGDALYGRYWGCREDYPFLHFELCYHQAIDYAIAMKLARVEAGAQGEHKIARGYEPVETRSAHWIADPGLRAAIARYLDAERTQNAEEIEMLGDFAPFRKE